MTTDLPVGPAAPVPVSSTATGPSTPAAGRRRAARGRSWRRLVVENAAVVLVFALAGLAGGWVWSELWDPPLGAVQDREWLYLDFAMVGTVFSGTGLYVVVGLVGGTVLGVVAALVARTSELVTLAAVVLGSVVAGYLAHQVGVQRSPTDPRLLALVVPDGTELPGRLEVTGSSPFVAWPLGSLVGLAVTYFLTSGASAGVEGARRVDVGPADPSGPTAPPRHV